MALQPSFRLDHRIGWRLAWSEGIAWNDNGARLMQRPGTLLPIDDPSGDLGGRAMPRHVAAGPGGQLFLITAKGDLLWYDPCRELFEPIPCNQKGRLGLIDPVAITVTSSGELLVLDGQSRMVTVLSLADWRVKRQWGPFIVADGGLRKTPLHIGIEPTTGQPTGALVLPENIWHPRDIAALPDGLIVLSEGETDTIAFFDWRGCLVKLSDGATDSEAPLRGPDALAVANDGSIYVLERDVPAIARLDGEGHIIARSEEENAEPEPIEAARLAIDHDGTIWVSSRLPGAARAHCCEPTGRIAPLTNDRMIPADCDLLAFNSDGQAVFGSLSQPCLLRAEQIARIERGSITFERLDGGQSETVWDRVRITCQIPEGTELRLLAYASDVALDALNIAALPESAWTNTVLNEHDNHAVAAIRTSPGRYLWVRLEFAGDGIATPAIYALTVTYPRRSSARHLPAVWSSEPSSADFLQRFMMLFDEVRADVLEPLNQLPALFDPMATTAAEAGAHGDDFLDWLGAWIGLALDRNWSVERRRQLVAQAPALFRIKGTVEGLSRHVEIYTGIAPKIVEHFKLRRWVTLDESQLDGSEALWGPDLIRRLELDGYAEIGRFSLVDGGDPLTDPIAAFAHRATVYVPVSDGFSESDFAALEAVVDAARPAHVVVDVHVVKPQFVIGCDTLLGVNTILGTGLETAVIDETILGDDIRLAGPPHTFSLSATVRLGIDTNLE